MSLIQRDHFSDNLIDAIEDLKQRIGDLERAAKTGTATTITVDVTDISNPPTDAELDTIFGEPADVGAGFVALINDNGAGSAEYLVWSDGAKWWHAAGTAAV